LRLEQVEDRIAPAIFTVQDPAYTFAAGVMNNNGCVAVADFNKDGRMDAVFSNFGSGYGTPTQPNTTPGNTITILRGTPTGFTPTQVLNTGGENVSFVSVADINSDTFPDIVAVNENRQVNQSSVSVFRNMSGNFVQMGADFNTFNQNASWVGLADVTGDTILDIVVGAFGYYDNTTVVGNNVTIFQGNATKGVGNFTYQSIPITTLQNGLSFIPTALAVDDFDGDNIKDIVAAVPAVPPDAEQPHPPGSIYVFKGLGSGSFAAPNQAFGQGSLPINIQAADLNGDGKKDLVVANAGDPNSTFFNDSVDVYSNLSSTGNPTFVFSNGITASCFGPFATAVADFNVDGKMDIASINHGAIPPQISPAPFVTIYLGDGSGQIFTPEPGGGTYNTTGLIGGQYIAVGNFDANPTPDLILAHATGQVGLLRNNTSVGQAPTVTEALVNGTTANQRSRVTSIQVTFDTQVTFAGGNTAGAFTITRNGGGPVNFQATANVVGGVTVVTLTNFTGLETEANLGLRSLRDGRYTLTVLAANVSAGGQQMASNFTFGDAQKFFRMYGDFNGDRQVDGADFGAFSSTYNLTSASPAFLAFFDVNGDNVIDGFEFSQFSARFNTVLGP
jgi:hypothetical protein